MAPGPNIRKPQHKFIRTDSVAWTLFGPIWKCELRSILIFVWTMGTLCYGHLCLVST